MRLSIFRNIFPQNIREDYEISRIATLRATCDNCTRIGWSESFSFIGFNALVPPIKKKHENFFEMAEKTHCKYAFKCAPSLVFWRLQSITPTLMRAYLKSPTFLNHVIHAFLCIHKQLLLSHLLLLDWATDHISYQREWIVLLHTTQN